MPGRRRPFGALQPVLHQGDLSALQLQQPLELNELVFLSLELEGSLAVQCGTQLARSLSAGICLCRT
jgi:hypothetical protein